MKNLLDIKTMERRAVNRGEVLVFGTRYFAHALCAYNGQHVDAEYDINHGDYVRVFELQGKFICEAMIVVTSPYKPNSQGHGYNEIQMRNTQNA